MVWVECWYPACKVLLHILTYGSYVRGSKKLQPMNIRNNGNMKQNRIGCICDTVCQIDMRPTIVVF